MLFGIRVNLQPTPCRRENIISSLVVRAFFDIIYFCIYKLHLFIYLCVRVSFLVSLNVCKS